jgi:hypothetical protein
MDKAEKKRWKAEAKRQKKLAKAQSKQIPIQLEGKSQPSEQSLSPDSPSPAVRFAESVRGIIYIIFAVSLLAALVLGQKNIIISLDDIIQHLLLANLGKVILAVIALALFIYGLKHLRLVK